MLEAFGEVRAGGFFADGVQLVFAQQLFDAGDFVVGGDFDAYPIGFAQQGIRLLDFDGDTRQFFRTPLVGFGGGA